MATSVGDVALLSARIVIVGVPGAGAPPGVVAPIFTTSPAISLSGRTITVTTGVASGEPAPTIAIAATLDGAPVVMTGSGPWSHVAASSASAAAFAATVTAGNGVSPDATQALGIAIPSDLSAPSVMASAALSGRTLTIAVDGLTGAPAPSASLATLTLDGVDVLGDASGTGPWSYVAPSSAAPQTIAWTVSATNGVSPDATASGSELIGADLSAPVAAGALADLTLAQGVAMAAVDVAADFTGTAPIAYALAPGSAALPAGLSLSGAGVLSGTPTAEVGGASIVVRGTNAHGFADSGFTLTVSGVLAFGDPDWSMTEGTASGVLVVALAQIPGAPGEVIAVDYEVNGEILVRVDGAPASFEIAGLPNGEAASIRIRPVTAVVEQAWSSAKTATPRAPALPAQMGAPTLVGGETSATLTLAAAPDAGDAAIATYGYQVIGAAGSFDSPWAQGTVPAADRATPIPVTPLSAGSYLARARATSALGSGPWSAVSAAASVTAAPSFEMLTAVDGGVFVRAGGFVTGDARYSMNWTTGVMTVTAGAATLFADISFYSNFGAGVEPLPVGETVEFNGDLNVTASGQFGVGVRGVGSTVVYSTGGQSPTFATGAQTYTGTVVVPAARDATFFGHAIALRIGSTFAGTVDIGNLARRAIASVPVDPPATGTIRTWTSTSSFQDWSAPFADAATSPFLFEQNPWNMGAAGAATLVTTLGVNGSDPVTLRTTVDAGAGASNGLPLAAPYAILGFHYAKVSPVNPLTHGAGLRGLATDGVNQCLVSIRETETGGGEYFAAIQSYMFRGPLQSTDFSMSGGSRADGEFLYDVQVRHFDTWSITTDVSSAIDVTVGGVPYKFLPSQPTAKGRGCLFLRVTDSHAPTDVDMAEIFRIVRDHWNAVDGVADDFYVQQIGTWVEPLKGVIDYTLTGFRVALNGVFYGEVIGDTLPGTTFPTFSSPPSLLLQSGTGDAGSALGVVGGTWDDGDPPAAAYPDGRYWKWYLDGVRIVPPAFGYDAAAVDPLDRANSSSLRVTSALATAGGTITARAVKFNIHGSYDQKATGSVNIAAAGPGDTLPGTGTIDLAKTVSHVQIAAPSGAAVAPGWARAGLQAGTAGAHIYRVTTLTDGTGAGTLRHAVTDGTANNNPGDPTDGQVLTGPRFVVFDVAGVINLNSELGFGRPKTYVAGHTAPGHVVLRNRSTKCRVSDVVVRHMSFVHGLPANKTDSANAGGFGVVKFTGVATDNIKIERVWLDHYLVSAIADQGPFTFTNARNETNDVSFTNGVVVETYRAPNLNSPWQNFHETNHNLGPFIGERSLRCTVAGNVIAGCAFRTPQVKLATQTAIMGNFIHDFQPRGYDYQPAPIQISSTDDVGDVSLFPNGKTVRIAAAGNYAEPGQLTRAGGSTISGGIMERLASTDPARRVYAYHGPNRIDPTLAGAISNPDGKPLGPNGEAVTPNSTTGHVVLASPEVWSEYQPTWPGETRAYALAHAGPRPSAPHALQSRTLTKIAAQAAKSFSASAREKLYRDAAANPTDAFTGAGPTQWTPPANPFSVAPNGLTDIENALNALSDSLGGTPWGNVDRPLTTVHGGRLEITRAGVVSWTPEGAHPDIVLNVTFTDGETRTVTIAGA